jgi:diphosphomevalonate decarboxylase
LIDVTTATAHPNIALVKYWGKQPGAGNLPATPNLSITLSDLTTTTTVSDADQDEVHLNGHRVKDAKIFAFLALLRANFSIGPLRIETDNNFPTGAGLASSASGFAALITAINAHTGLGLNAAALSSWARQGSASAARSILPGFVSLAPPTWQAEPIADNSHWPLCTVVAVTSTTAKAVSSTRGMEISRRTSPFFDAWVDGSEDDYNAARRAIQQRDFERLSQVAELNCLKMHGMMLTSTPTLAYWNAASVACMETVRELRSAGSAVFFTIDAGPQVKAVCLPEDAANVAQALSQVPGVYRTIRCGLGDGARVVQQ